MRALRVVGVHEDGQSIVLEDPARHEQFLVPADERLRAAARGDITRLGQIEIETESQLRPREIQARVRAGESVQQVAASSGLSEARVERFAYPVLLERSRTAQMAQSAHPIRDDGPDVRTLAEVVAYSFGVRGQDYSAAEWDSWKGEDRKWVVELRWQNGRSDLSAHWQFAPGAHGGTVTALDEHAEELLDPNSAPRGLRAVELEPLLGRVPKLSREHKPAREPEPAAELTRAPGPAPKPAAAAEPEPEKQPDPEKTTARVGQAAARVGQAAEQTARAEQKRAQQAILLGESAERPKPKPRSRQRPTVPAWEDVLLGVRSQRG